jgi:hypothetical protein
MVKHGPILKKFLLKCQAKLEFFQNGRLKYFTKQTLVISVKNQNHKSQFFDGFCSCAPLTHELEQKMFA